MHAFVKYDANQARVALSASSRSLGGNLYHYEWLGSSLMTYMYMALNVHHIFCTFSKAHSTF